MGVTIRSKNYSCDMSYGGFSRFRSIIAEDFGETLLNHYKKLLIIGASEKDEEYLKNYDKETEKIMRENNIPIEVVDFLYQADCDGKIDEKQASIIYKIIERLDDQLAFGYIGRRDCARMKDLKLIMKDESEVKWF